MNKDLFVCFSGRTKEQLYKLKEPRNGTEEKKPKRRKELPTDRIEKKRYHVRVVTVLQA